MSESQEYEMPPRPETPDIQASLDAIDRDLKNWNHSQHPKAYGTVELTEYIYKSKAYMEAADDRFKHVVGSYRTKIAEQEEEIEDLKRQLSKEKAKKKEPVDEHLSPIIAQDRLQRCHQGKRALEDFLRDYLRLARLARVSDTESLAGLRVWSVFHRDIFLRLNKHYPAALDDAKMQLPEFLALVRRADEAIVKMDPCYYSKSFSPMSIQNREFFPQSKLAHAMFNLELDRMDGIGSGPKAKRQGGHPGAGAGG